MDLENYIYYIRVYGDEFLLVKCTEEDTKTIYSHSDLSRVLKHVPSIVKTVPLAGTLTLFIRTTHYWKLHRINATIPPIRKEDF